MLTDIDFQNIMSDWHYLAIESRRDSVFCFLNIRLYMVLNAFPIIEFFLPIIHCRSSTKAAPDVTNNASCKCYLKQRKPNVMKAANYQNIIYEYRFAANNSERTEFDHMSSMNLLRSQYDPSTTEEKCIVTESLLRVGSITIIGLISYLLVLIF